MVANFDPKVFALGYIALNSPELSRTRDHYVETLGLNEIARGDDDAIYLSVGYNHHDLVLRPADQKSLAHLGLQLKPHISVSDMAGQLRELGLKPELKSDSQPGVAELVEVEAPGGLIFQFFSEIAATKPGFKTAAAAPLRLGHAAIISPDGDKLVRFFLDFLGFAFTDDIGGVANFMTCNRDHHVVNIMKAPESRVHHFAFELKNTPQHTAASDALRAAQTPVQWGPARHTAGHNIASYHRDPDKVLVELYTEMDVFIPELGMCEPRPWHEHVPMKPRSWGFHELNAWGPDFAYNLAAG